MPVKQLDVLVLCTACGVLAAKIALIIAFNRQVFEASAPEAIAGSVYLPLIDGCSLLALLTLIAGIVMLVRGQRNWKLYLSFPLAVLGVFIAPFFYVIK